MSTYHQLETAIYFLKVPELKSLITQANLKRHASKQAMINELLAFARGETYDHTADAPQKSMQELKEMGRLYDPDQHIVPGVYSNNAINRARFIQLIGPHFSYTTYGMNWIRAQWQAGHCPTYQEFATYWQQEYDRRKTTGDFKSPKTLQRVNFFRKMKVKNLTKTELEAAWYEERKKQAELAHQILLDAIKSGTPVA